MKGEYEQTLMPKESRHTQRTIANPITSETGQENLRTNRRNQIKGGEKP